MRRLRTIDQEAGFTIIELLIATTVLTLILLLSTVMITSIGTLYYKGVTLSQTQDSTRSIADQVVQDIQLTSGVVSNGTTTFGSTVVSAMCIGTVRYSYILDRQIGTDSTAPANQIKHVLWRDTVSSGAACLPADITLDPVGSTPATVNGMELVGNKSRLTAFSAVSPLSSSLYTIDVGVAFGDNDLLSGSGATTNCNGGVADHFCAVSTLSTAAIRRFSGGH